jgi:hypothetical protein
MDDEQARAAYREKLRSIGFDRGHLTKQVDVTDERDGRRAGWQTEHRDGRVDATVTPKPIIVGTQIQEG